MAESNPEQAAGHGAEGRAEVVATQDVGSFLGRGLWQPLVGLVVVVACFWWGVPAFAPYREVGELLAVGFGQMGLVTAVALSSVALFNLVAPSISQTAALPGLSLRRAVWADWSTTTVTNLIPGGSAFAIGLIWAMYRSFGLARAAITRSIVVTGVWDVLVKLGTPLPALIWLSTQRSVGPGFGQAALVGGVLFVVAGGLGVVLLTGPGTANRLGRLIDRLPMFDDGWPQRLDSLRSETVDLLRERGWALTVWTIVGHFNLYVLLVLCLRAVGVERSVLGWAPVLAAFAFGRLVTAIPLTPGGLGVMEVGLTGALTAVAELPADLSNASLVAGVLLFRFFSYAVPLPLGAVGLLWWNTNGRRD